MRPHGRHRSYPHLRGGDAAVLDVLAAACGREAARDFERLLEAQHRQGRLEVLVAADVDLGVSDAAFRHGAGGGWRRHAPPPHE